MKRIRTKTSFGLFMERLLSSIFSIFLSKSIIFSLILVLFIVASFIINNFSNTYATTSTLTISVTDSISLNIAPTNSAGTFAHSDTTTPNISVKTTNGSGYTLGIKASTSGANNNALINSNDNTKYIPSITTSGGISESIYNTDSSYNNTWAYRPSKLNSQANSNYIPAPNSNTNITVLDATTTSNPTTDNTYNIALGTRINSNTAPGSYANTFIITATVNPIPYTITYNKNTTDTVTNMPSNVSSSTFSETVTITNQVPARDGYSFEGWCTSQVADDESCIGTSYVAGATWTIDQTISSNSLTLYARWKATTPKNYIQDLTLSQCRKNVGTNGNDADIGDNITVYDKRDGNDYTVRYINGNCWMTQNLRVTGIISAEYSNFTGNDFNVSQYSLSKDDSSYSGHCDPTNGYNYACSKDSGSTSTGAWYNYYAASAGTISTSSNSTTATSDICPSGWHLPTGPAATSGTELYKLVGNTQRIWQKTSGLAAFGAVAGGYYNNGSLGETERGYWSSANAPSSTYRYYLLYNSSTDKFSGSGNYYRYFAYFIRCVLSS